MEAQSEAMQPFLWDKNPAPSHARGIERFQSFARNFCSIKLHPWYIIICVKWRRKISAFSFNVARRCVSWPWQQFRLSEANVLSFPLILMLPKYARNETIFYRLRDINLSFFGFKIWIIPLDKNPSPFRELSKKRLTVSLWQQTAEWVKAMTHTKFKNAFFFGGATNPRRQDLKLMGDCFLCRN